MIIFNNLKLYTVKSLHEHKLVVSNEIRFTVRLLKLFLDRFKGTIILMSTIFNEEKQEKRLDELHYKEAEELARVLSGRYQIPYTDLSKTSINAYALRLIPEPEARAANMAIFKAVGKKLSLGTASPTNDKLKTIVTDLERKNFSITLYVVSEASLEWAWGRYGEVANTKKTEAGMIDISNEHIAAFLEEFKKLEDITTAIGTESIRVAKEGGISTILEIILSGALALEASDVHIEPEETDIRLRYRIDGVLQDVANFDPKIYRPILSRIKLISGLKLNVKQSAQDGRFSINAGSDVDIEIRTSVIPGAYGESIVMRVLNPKSIETTFNSLGIPPDLYKIFDREIRKPNGLVLLTGPTGSGKTTTLYSFLREVNSTEAKIITIEDPIEYHLKGVNQTQVNREKGYTFLSGLRSALRQDPDVIMVGEIRDSETAKIAINSALTGHLVFSTLHTNNAAGAIPRLIDLGVNAKIISSALTLSIAQRLVRKLCEYCKQESVLAGVEKDQILAVVESIKKKIPDYTPKQIEKMWLPGKCEKCNNTGYKGRQGIFEAIIMDEKIAAATILNPNERDIKTAAIPQGILDMRQDGIVKVLDGTTSLRELSRVIDLYDEII